MTTLESTVHIPEDVLFREVGEEAVILNMENGKYYGLNEVGTRMWVLLVEHGTLQTVYEHLLAEYDAPEAQIRRDLLDLVNDLITQGLLELAT